MQGLGQDLFGLKVSLGQVCALEQQTAANLKPIVAEVREYLQTQPVNVDETSWRENKKKAWLWGVIGKFVTLFAIDLHRSRTAFSKLLDTPAGFVITSDRYRVYEHLPAKFRQLCWAHLRRDFQAMLERQNAGSVLGEDLLALANILLRHWQRVRDGTLSRAHFQKHQLPPLRAEVFDLLQRGSTCGCAQTAAVCGELLKWEESLWTFATVVDVEPTNNAAERALRHAVQWRKTSYGTQSAAGSRYVERVLTVVASCRQQGRNVLEFLTDAILAARMKTTPPSLIPVNP